MNGDVMDDGRAHKLFVERSGVHCMINGVENCVVTVEQMMQSRKAVQSSMGSIPLFHYAERMSVVVDV